MSEQNEYNWHVEASDGFSATGSLSPVTYFPEEPDRIVRRMTRSKDNTPIFCIDYTIEDDTMYVLSLQVEPEYRDGKWLEYVNFDRPESKGVFEEGYNNFGKFSKTVWIGYTETPTFKKALEKRDNLSKKKIMVDSEIYMQGNTIKYHNTKNPLDK